MSQLTSRGLDNTTSAFVSDIYISKIVKLLLKLIASNSSVFIGSLDTKPLMVVLLALTVIYPVPSKL